MKVFTKRKFIILAGILCIAVLAPGCKPSKQDPRPTNLIILFADDLGYGDLACYGHPNIKTPHLDAMAAEGIRFTSFYAAASVCTPSRAALLTGRYPIRTTPYNFGPESKNGLPVSEITLANILQEQGYATKAIGKWHLGHQPEYLPTSRGFESFYGLPYSNDMILPWCPWLNEADRLFLYEDSVPAREIGYNQEELTVDYTHAATEFIRSHANEPFFLYFAHSMPHLPISTSKEFVGKSEGGLYGDVIETIDWSVGEIFATLKETGLDNHTLVAFASDNGPWNDLPERMKQQGVEEWHTGSAGLLRGAKASTYEGGFRVPAIIRWPKQIPAHQVSTKVVTTMDLFATLIPIAGAAVPDDRIIDGHNILSLLKTGEGSTTEKFFYFKEATLQAVRKGAWKLRATRDAGFELYNLSNDVGERYNVAEQHPQLVEELLQELITFSAETHSKMDLPDESKTR